MLNVKDFQYKSQIESWYGMCMNVQPKKNGKPKVLTLNV